MARRSIFYIVDQRTHQHMHSEAFNSEHNNLGIEIASKFCTNEIIDSSVRMWYTGVCKFHSASRNGTAVVRRASLASGKEKKAECRHKQKKKDTATFQSKCIILEISLRGIAADSIQEKVYFIPIGLPLTDLVPPLLFDWESLACHVTCIVISRRVGSYVTTICITDRMTLGWDH